MSMATTNGRRIFVDTNILTRATIDVAPLHRQARTNAELYISHQVIREYVANATRPQSYTPALPIHAVLKQVEDFRKTFHILPDSPAVLSRLLELVNNVAVGGKQIHDANIVATMLAYKIEELLTHNLTDFQRYHSFIRILPLDQKTA
jgi:predicted nucleic acid-binding protein